MLTRFIPVAVLVLAAMARGETTHYVGTINNNLGITLSISDPYQEKVSGAYRYAQFGKDLYLKGSRERNVLTLAETDRAGTRTGSFKISPAAGTEFTGDLSGAWESADGKKSFSVSLTPVAKSVVLTSARSDRYTVETAYLKCVGNTPFAAALNARFEKSASDSHNERVRSVAAESAQEASVMGTLPFTSSIDVSILHASDSLMSIRGLHYEYTGGAHGNSHHTAENLAWVNGKVVALGPADIVAVASWPELCALCVKELTARKASWPDQIIWNMDRGPTLNVTGSGVQVTFDPYEVGSYAEGVYVVALPWSSVKGMVPANSALRTVLPGPFASR